MMPMRLHLGFLLGLLWATTTAVCGFTSKPFTSSHRTVVLSTHGFKPLSLLSRTTRQSQRLAANGFIPPSPFDDDDDLSKNNEVCKAQTMNPSAILALAAIPALALPLPAEAAGGTGFAIQSALAAYVHYASLLVCTGALVVERVTVDANLTPEQEDTLAVADAVYGVAALGLLVSGIYRATEYGKGWDFYSHEPLFWLKLTLVGVWGASSLFPTIQFVKRSLERRSLGSTPQNPISPALAARLKQVINAELLALVSVPLAATLMSRGVLYSSEIPWQAGAAVTALVTVGLTYKYVKEGLTWKEPEAANAVEE